MQLTRINWIGMYALQLPSGIVFYTLKLLTGSSPSIVTCLNDAILFTCFPHLVQMILCKCTQRQFPRLKLLLCWYLQPGDQILYGKNTLKWDTFSNDWKSALMMQIILQWVWFSDDTFKSYSNKIFQGISLAIPEIIALIIKKIVSKKCMRVRKIWGWRGIMVQGQP